MLLTFDHAEGRNEAGRAYADREWQRQRTYPLPAFAVA
jgi:hypothetical protein